MIKLRRVSTWLKVSQMVSGRAGIQTQLVKITAKIHSGCPWSTEEGTSLGWEDPGGL